MYYLKCPVSNKTYGTCKEIEKSVLNADEKPETVCDCNKMSRFN